MRGLARLARKAFQFSLILAVISRYLTFAWVTHRLVVGLGLVVGAVLFALLLLSFCSLTNLCDRVINR